MKLPVAVLLLACEAAAFSWTGNFGERIVSGSSAQFVADRYGNINQLHGKHCHDYTREREEFEATRDRNIRQSPPPQQRRLSPPEAPEEERQQPPAAPESPTAAASATEEIPAEQIPTGVPPPQENPQEVWHQAASANQMQPLNVHDARYGMTPPPPPPPSPPPPVAAASATSTAVAQKKSSTPVIQGPSSTTANRIGDRYANSLNDDTSNKTGAKPVPDTRSRRLPGSASAAAPAVSPDAVRNRGELHGGYGGYSQALGTFSTVSGSSAQFVADRYGNINQLHGKHCHDYTREREEFEAAQNQNVLPRPDDIVGKDPNVNQEAC
jgi:hypothetical protein